VSLNSFTPNTKIESAKVTANFTNLSNHGRNFNVIVYIPNTLVAETRYAYFSFPDAGTIERVDLALETVPTGAAVIVDIERSTDGGGTWTTIFTGGTNRPQVAVSSRTGSTTTIDVPAIVANSYLYRIKIAQVGSTIAGADMTVSIKGKYNLD